MKRVYTNLLREHLESYRQMIFIAGPRQVGKTTLAKTLFAKGRQTFYFNWDAQEDRQLIVAGQKTVADSVFQGKLSKQKVGIIFDEIHKYGKWKNFLKGFFDLYHERASIVVTGSSRLDIYRRSQDSLMGRFFLYRLHPFTVGEILQKNPITNEICPPHEIAPQKLQQLIEFGGFPEPFTIHKKPFYERWKKMRLDQMFRDDIRDLTRVTDIGQLEILAFLLSQQTGQLTSMSSFAQKVNVTVRTVAGWLQLLESFYYCFRLSPWTKNITRSILKEPKFYLWDWSEVSKPGPRLENMVAVHLLKAIHGRQDAGFGDYGLYFLRNKEKKEVDFIATRNDQPWFLVEVKTKADFAGLKNLDYFQKMTKAKHAFQVAFDQPYVDKNCFDVTTPTIVPATTFLSQFI